MSNVRKNFVFKSLMELHKISAWSFFKFESNQALTLTRSQFQEKADSTKTGSDGPRELLSMRSQLHGAATGIFQQGSSIKSPVSHFHPCQLFNWICNLLPLFFIKKTLFQGKALYKAFAVLTHCQIKVNSKFHSPLHLNS